MINELLNRLSKEKIESMNGPIDEIEDFLLGIVMEEADVGNYVSENELFKVIDNNLR